MKMNGNGRYKLSRPIYRNGDTAYFWFIISKMNDGDEYTRGNIDALGKYMTFQALQQCGLITNTKGIYHITQTGREYVAYYKNESHPKKSFFEFNVDKSNHTQIKQSFNEMMGNPNEALASLSATKPINKVYTVTVITTDGKIVKQQFENVEHISLDMA